jgi:hypothetical protein
VNPGTLVIAIASLADDFVRIVVEGGGNRSRRRFRGFPDLSEKKSEFF